MEVSLIEWQCSQDFRLALSPLNLIPCLGHQINFHLYIAKFSIFMSRLVLSPELHTYVFH